MDNKSRFNRKDFEKEIEEFKKWKITNRGLVDKENYKAWFYAFLEERCKNSSKIEEYMETIELANFISLCALDDEKVYVLLRNGGLKPKELNDFILKKTTEQSKKDAVAKMIQEELEKSTEKKKKPKRKQEEDLEHKDDNNTNTQDSSAETDLDVLDTAVLLFMPLVAEQAKKGHQDKVAELVEFFASKLDEAGFDQKAIEASINRNLYRKDDIPKTMSKLKSQQKEEYNPYTDFRFLYYMASLGVDYHMIYATPDKAEYSLKDLFKVSPSHTEPEKTVWESGYVMDYIRFKHKYDTQFDIDGFRNKLKASDTKENYTKTFKEAFTEAYKNGDNIDNIVDFLIDFENIAQMLCCEEHIKSFMEFGGIPAAGMEKFLLDLREPDVNILMQTKDSLTTVYGDLASSDAKVLSDQVEGEFSNLLSSKDPTAVRVAVAEYRTLNEVHASRSFSYMVRHPAKYLAESNAIHRMKDSLDSEDNPTLGSVIREALSTEKIYKNGHQKELKDIHDFGKKTQRKQRHSQIIDMKDETDVFGFQEESLLDRTRKLAKTEEKAPKTEPIPSMPNWDKNRNQ